MPIYAYRCASCGHAKDVLQKMSDPLLTVCPACGAPAFEKQLTSAGFQLKGSGWYVTDFRGGNGGKKSEPKEPGAQSETAPSGDAAAPPKSDATAPAASTVAASSAPSAASPVATPATKSAAPPSTNTPA